MVTSKYLKLSSWGTALIPGTLFDQNVRYIRAAFVQLHMGGVANGSCMSLSVSLMIRFGKAAIVMNINQQTNEVKIMLSCYLGEKLLGGGVLGSAPS